MKDVTENSPIKPQIKTLASPPARPRVPNLNTLSQSKLFQFIKNDNSSSASFQYLTELVRRTLEKNQELYKRIITLEQEISNLQAMLNPPKKKCGRKATDYFIDGKLLDDDYLEYLIDSERYTTLGELERDVGAKKCIA